MKDFVPSLATKFAPLYDLLKDNTVFDFNESCRIDFDDVKHHLQSDPILAHFNPQMNVKGITDASKQGLGAVLKQQAADCRWYYVSC